MIKFTVSTVQKFFSVGSVRSIVVNFALNYRFTIQISSTRATMSVVNVSSHNSLKSLSSAMGRMFRDAAASGTSDVVVQCGQQEIPAHRIILMARYDVKCIYLYILRLLYFKTV